MGKIKNIKVKDTLVAHIMERWSQDGMYADDSDGEKTELENMAKELAEDITKKAS